MTEKYFSYPDLQVAKCPESHMTIVAQALEALEKKMLSNIFLPTEMIGN
jgi:hypothetical protein